MATAKMNSLQTLLDFLAELDCHKIGFRLERNRTEAIMVRVDVPGERWEIEFFVDGNVEIETFRSTECGVVGGSEARAALRRLLVDFG